MGRYKLTISANADREYRGDMMNVFEAIILDVHARICRETREMNAKTRVGNIRDYRNWTDDIVYIGRRCKWHKRWLKRSMFANPFKIGDKHPERKGEVINRAESIKLYHNWFHQQLRFETGFSEAVEELRGKVLLCWCAPLDCHGRIIQEYLERNE